MSVKPRKIAIWGYGREGQAALVHLQALHPGDAFTILNDTPLDTAPPAQVRVLTGEAAGEALRTEPFDIIVKSPGISLYRPEATAARALGATITSATNLWFKENASAHTIAVTGTKGKSTTSRLLHHILQQAGRDVALLGNVGVAALGQKAGRDHTVLELSSYQIADLAHAPSMAVITNLYVDHVPWHGSIAQYHTDKLRLIADPSTRAVLNHGNAGLRSHAGQRANVLWYNRDDGFHVRDGALFFRDQKVDTSQFPLRGSHNLENLAAACTVADDLGIEGLRQRVAIPDFAQLRHRQEEFRTKNGVLCVNDSISTVPEATLVALEAYRGLPCVLILGGHDRGQNHAALLDYLPGAGLAALLLLPDTGRRIAEEMKGRDWPFPIVPVDDLAQAVREAMARVPQDGVVMLSPAAPSFGQFRNFEDRGDRFKALIEAVA
ncbi:MULTISPECIES: UDP-N-acetylmuramoyl-L-alanine--D-glutamate ligase [unclassified Beijerinckia]|uniref:UDP-N-acetylmuramoyl-L-alanine--D-glutamate ligase n=1 Tax=unclassified Beijerinckia TaxID=2638183 RepID=UPI00089769BB|nr:MULTISPECIES: UDP-N-acetylmuramoyl-L-alanine--D-glutamate ligase [unclassified Beijerinckia]MDH7798592.1 UDP-N-acetylmuramoylalanine--D-glutamate ligase [Beijerinckia sp. GAS462]SED26015.1 UDP-N-acetylmuramoylalanine--D-glutamate ligase [Beijerinckia sp. 28-YEA-48]